MESRVVKAIRWVFSVPVCRCDRIFAVRVLVLLINNGVESSYQARSFSCSACVCAYVIFPSGIRR